jgi:hypothetical protein
MGGIAFGAAREKAMTNEDILLRKRDAKVKPTLEAFAPVWLVDQQIFPDDESVQFNAIFQHNIYGWVSRRYRYDGFNDVLYYKGQRIISEDEALEVQMNDPYITVAVSDIPNAYGG